MAGARNWPIVKAPPSRISFLHDDASFGMSMSEYLPVQLLATGPAGSWMTGGLRSGPRAPGSACAIGAVTANAIATVADPRILANGCGIGDSGDAT